MMTKNKYNGCKLKVFNSAMYGSMEEYEKAVNTFLSQYNIVEVVPTLSAYTHGINIFYQDEEEG